MTEADKYRQFVLDNQDLIRQLAWTYAEKMSEAAEQAHTAWKAGVENPEVRAAQDGSLITNNGYRNSAAMFKQSAASARKLAKELDRLCDEALDEDGD